MLSALCGFCTARLPEPSESRVIALCGWQVSLERHLIHGVVLDLSVFCKRCRIGPQSNRGDE